MIVVSPRRHRRLPKSTYAAALFRRGALGTRPFSVMPAKAGTQGRSSRHLRRPGPPRSRLSGNPPVPRRSLVSSFPRKREPGVSVTCPLFMPGASSGPPPSRRGSGGQGGKQGARWLWIPAFAGMTEGGRVASVKFSPLGRAGKIGSGQKRREPRGARRRAQQPSGDRTRAGRCARSRRPAGTRLA
jgi:hypothetical protein